MRSQLGQIHRGLSQPGTVTAYRTPCLEQHPQYALVIIAQKSPFAT
jgi:hypothetical protein